MDKELVNAAAQTFCLAPEIYKDAFKQAGADIPDEVIQAVQQDPKKGMEILQGDKKFLEGVVKVFADNQEAIMQYVQEKQAGASKMFNGGKLGYLARKYQVGGGFVKTFITITPDKDTMINQRFPISSGDFVNKTYTNRDWQYDQIMDRMRSTGVFDALKEYKKGGSLKIK